MPVYPTGRSSVPIDFVSAGLDFFNSTVEQRLKDVESKTIEADKNEKRMLKAMSIQAIPELSGAMRDRYQVEIKGFRDKMTDVYSEKKGQLSIDDKKYIEENSIKLQNEMNAEKNWLDKYKAARDQMASPNFNKVVGDTDSYMSELQSMYERKMKGEDVEDPLSLSVKYRRKETPLEYLIGTSGKEISALDQLVQKTVDEKTGQVVTVDQIEESAIEDLFQNKFDTDSNFRAKFYVRDANGAPVLDQAGKPTFDKEKIGVELQNTTDALSKSKRVEDEYSYRNLMRAERKAKEGTGVRAYWTGKGDIGQVEYDQSTDLKDSSEMNTPSGATVIDAKTGRSISPQSKTGTAYAIVRKGGKPFIAMQYKGGGIASDKGGSVYYATREDANFDPKSASSYRTQSTYDKDPKKTEGLLRGVDEAKYKDATFSDIKVNPQPDGTLKITGTATVKGDVKAKFGLPPWKRKAEKTEEVEKILYPMYDRGGTTEALIPLNKESASYLGKGDRKFMLSDEKMTIEEYAVQQPLMSKSEVESVLFGKDKETDVVEGGIVVYEVDGKVADVPKDQVEAFLKKYPKAVKK